MNLIIIIPHYNDNIHLPELINRVRKMCKIQILVIDDGSKVTPELDESIIHLINRKNRGKGYSLKKAFSYACGLGYTHAITVDADLQHLPENINLFIDIDSSIDLVLGYRSFTKPMPLIRILSNSITTRIIQILCRTNKVLDSQSGYRRYNLKKVLSLDCRENGFHYETEILIKMVSYLNISIENVKIETVYSNEISSISNVKDTVKFIFLIIRSFFWKMA